MSGRFGRIALDADPMELDKRIKMAREGIKSFTDLVAMAKSKNDLSRAKRGLAAAQATLDRLEKEKSRG